MDYAIKAAMLIDGRGSKPVLDAVMTVKNGVIEHVGAAVDTDLPVDADVVDFGSSTLMPGLIDCHIHLLKTNVRFFKDYQLATATTPPSLLQMYALRSAQIMLEAGFTTIKNMPTSLPWEPRAEMFGVAVRDAVNAGLFAGPRIVTGGLAHITGSHFDLMTSRNSPRVDRVTADGPWGMRRAVREIVRGGADFVKTCLSGGGVGPEDPGIQNMTQSEVDALVDEAHLSRKRVSAHCFTALSQKMAMHADVDVLEHCVFTDDEAIEMMVDRRQFIVPTLLHRSDKAIEQRRAAGAPKSVTAKMREIQPFCAETFQRVLEAGVPIVMGTDTGIDPVVGISAEELEIYVSLGMDPLDAIVSATSRAACAVGMEHVGSLEPGKLADFLVVDGNPLDDIRLLQDPARIRRVYKGGDLVVDRTGSDGSMALRQPEFGSVR